MDITIERLNIFTKISDLSWRFRQSLSFQGMASIVSLVLILAAVPATMYMFRSFSFLPTSADVAAVRLLVSPASALLPPNADFVVVLDAAENNIGFVRFILNFDQSKVQLTGDIQTTDQLKTVIRKTSVGEINQTGKAEIVLGLTPGDTAPTGSIQIANFSVTSVSLMENDSTIISIDPDDVQIVNLDVVSLSGVVQSAVVSLNPKAATPAPTATPTIAPTATDTPTDEPTASPSPTEAPIGAGTGETPTPSPQPTVTATAEATAQPTATPAPTVEPTATPLPTLAPQEFGQATPTPVPTAPPSPGDFGSSGSSSSGTSSSGSSSSSTSSGSSGSGKKGDINGDGKINVLDLSVMLSKFGTSHSGADLNGDGKISILDLSILLSRWGK